MENLSEVKQEDDIEASGLEETIDTKNNKEIMIKEQLEEYTIKEGDTLAGICKTKYGTTKNINKICELNKIKNADYIAPGQKIYLP